MYLFVVGFPRSGTTLLRAVLGSHPDIFLANEPELVLGLFQAGLTTQDKIPLEKRQHVLNILNEFKPCRRHLESLPTIVIQEFLNKSEEISLAQAYVMLLNPPSAEKQPLVLGDKSLYNLFLIKQIIKFLPDSHFVLIIRDPRAALLSLFRKKAADNKKISPGDQISPDCFKDLPFFQSGAMRWKAWMEAAREQKNAIAPEYWSQIIFEDFTSNPAGQIERLLLRIGLKMDQAILKPDARKGDPVLNSPSAFAHKKLAGPIDNSRAHSGEEMPNELNWVIERICQDEMQTWGYEPKAIAPNPMTRLAMGLVSRYYRDAVHSRLASDLEPTQRVLTRLEPT